MWPCPPANPTLAADSTPRRPELITLPDVAELLALPITKVHQLIKDGKLVVIRDDQGRRALPRIFVAGGARCSRACRR